MYPKNLKALSLLWPFFAFVISLKNFTNKKYRFSILYFLFLYGFGVYIQPNSDTSIHAEFFLNIANYNLESFFKALLNTLDVTGTKLDNTDRFSDFYLYTLMFVVSRFTDNYRWFFGFASFIYFYLQFKFLDLCIAEIDGRFSQYQKFFIIFLLTVIPFYNGVTGIRFWTGLYLFLILLLRFIKNKTLLNYFLIFSCCFVHFSFVIPILIIPIIFVLNYNIIISRSLIALSLIFIIPSFGNLTLGAISNKVEASADDSNISKKNEEYLKSSSIEESTSTLNNFNWYVRYWRPLIFYSIIFIFVYDTFFNRRAQKISFLKDLQPFLNLFFIFTLVTSILPFGSRFSNIFFCLFLLKYAIQSGNPSCNQISRFASYILLPAFILNLVMVLRIGSDTFNPYLFFSNQIFIYFFPADLCLSQLFT